MALEGPSSDGHTEAVGVLLLVHYVYEDAMGKHAEIPYPHEENNR